MTRRLRAEDISSLSAWRRSGSFTATSARAPCTPCESASSASTASLRHLKTSWGSSRSSSGLSSSSWPSSTTFTCCGWTTGAKAASWLCWLWYGESAGGAARSRRFSSRSAAAAPRYGRQRVHLRARDNPVVLDDRRARRREHPSRALGVARRQPRARLLLLRAKRRARLPRSRRRLSRGDRGGGGLRGPRPLRGAAPPALQVSH